MQHSHRFISKPVLGPIVVLTAIACLAPHAASGAPIIQEVFYDAAGPDGTEAFTEIFGPAGMPLDGWSLVGINGGTGASYRMIDLTGAVIPTDGLLLIATDSAGPALTAQLDFVACIDWQNGPDAVQLIDPFVVVIDALQYGEAGPNNAGFGSPAPDASAGSSLSRNLLGTNTGNNVIDFVVGTPSPGVGPTPIIPTSVPEPSTMVLLACGLVPLALRSHQRRARPR